MASRSSSLTAEEAVLYVYPGGDGVPSISPPCAKVVLALAYSRYPHRVEAVFGSAGGLSASGRLPVLQLAGESVCDSVAILDRLEQLALPRPISPTEPKARAYDRLWEHYVNDTFYWLGLYMRWCVPANHRRLMNRLLGERFSLRKLIARPLMSREVNRRARGQGIGLKSEDQIRHLVERGFDLFEAALPEQGYLGEGDAPGRGDFALASLISQGGLGGLTPQLAEQVAARTKLVAHMRQVYEVCELPVPGQRGPSS